MQFTADNFDRADYWLLRESPLNRVSSREALEQRVKSLEALGYRTTRLAFTTMEGFRRQVSNALKWKQQFGYDGWTGNLDALHDAFRDEPLASGPLNLWVIEGFPELQASDPKTGQCLLDDVCGASWNHLLFGGRFICLLLILDASFRPPTAGAVGVLDQWSPTPNRLQSGP